MSQETDPRQQEVLERIDQSKQGLGTRLKKSWVAFLFISPIFILFTALFYIPILRGLWLTLHKVALGGTNSYVGLENYVWMVSNDLFVYSLGWTIIFVAGTTALQIIVGLGIALMANEFNPGRREWLAAILVAPFFSAPLASGVINWWFLSPFTGVIARIMTAVGMDPIGFLSEGLWPFVSLILSQTWHDYGYSTIIYLAALQNTPKSQYEAAALAGAGLFRRFRDVTLPHLLTPTVIILAIRTARNIAEFAQPFELTGGGPGTSTMLLSILTYQVAYVEFNLGRAYTIGIVMLAISLGVTIVYIRSIQSEQELYV